MTTLTDINAPKVVQALKNGQLVVIPTDTVYGVVCQAADQAAVARIYELKQREHKPGSIIAASIEQLVELGFKRRYLTAVEQYWPGALSVVVPCADLAYLHLGLGGVAVRIPADDNLRKLMERTGPLQTSSANLTGQPTAVTMQQAQATFGDKIAIYVDGGDLSGRAPSTIIRIIDDEIEVLRQGSVTV